MYSFKYKKNAGIMLFFIFTFLSFPNPYIPNPKWAIKIFVNFYFHTSLRYHIFEVQQRTVKIKIYMKLILLKSLETLEMGRVKFL